MPQSTYSFVRTRKCKVYIPTHSHKNYEFVYFFSGKGTLWYENKQTTFSAGCYYLMEPGVLHSELYENTGKSLVVQFDKPQEDFNLSSLFQSDTALNLKRQCERILEELKNRLFGYDVVVESIMKEMLVLLARQQHKKAGFGTNSVQETIIYLDEYYMTNIKVAELAKDCGYSPDHYRVLFKQMTKQTPKEYILSKRIRLAKKLLKETKLSVTEISERCGFGSYAQFTVFFKSHTKYAPLSYRKLK